MVAGPASIAIAFMSLVIEGDRIHTGKRPFLILAKSLHKDRVRLVPFHSGERLNLLNLHLSFFIMASLAGDRTRFQVLLLSCPVTLDTGEV